MIHHWYWIRSALGRVPGAQQRLTFRTNLMKGPIYILGMYHANQNNASGFEIGYVDSEVNVPGAPPLNGLGAIIEAPFAPGVAPLPTPIFTRFDVALNLQDDTKLFAATKLEGFVPDFAPGSPLRDYTPLRLFVPLWAGCVCLSSTWQGNGADDLRVDVAIEVIEDVLSVPENIRDVLAGGTTDILDLLGELTLTAISQNSLFNFFSLLIQRGFAPGIPNPVIPELADLYLKFLEAF